ncbi:hypothetical protein [Paludibaculum fermentans]|uniref:Uncharacterized protein n=1 Tax=Paludibaculum fermentans TaxID=1473598 RepID=A0A7S7NXN3_PALFE|nr:hypothetical protein [Paludibaculum fermentans]QOY91693.1 hypothetical protein IRI77_17630 [Paludibaculum fermentans]
MLRKFSDGEFCTAEHRQIFQQQQSDLALARLIESQNRIERPAMAKPAPKPVMRTKAAVAEAEQAVPEARPIAEWFKPNGRKVLFVPHALPFDPKLSSSKPGCQVALQHQGFEAPEGLRLGLELSPLARNARQVVLNPLFRLGIRLPAGAKPVQPELEPEAAGLARLSTKTGLSMAAVVRETPAEIADFAGAACIPVLFCGTVAPDRQDALAPESLGLADALLPLACPIAGPVPVRTVTEVELNTAHPPQRWAVLPAIVADRAAEPDADPLPISEALLPVALPALERGSVCGIALPELEVPLALPGWGAEQDPALPANPSPRFGAELRTETEMARIPGPGALTVQPLLAETEITAQCELLEPALPLWNAAPPEAVMATSKRTARMKLRAMAAAAGFGQIAVEALPSERMPDKPQTLVLLQGGIDLAQDHTLRGIEVCAALSAARPLPAEAPGSGILDAAAAPCMPSGRFRPAVPDPVVSAPKIEEPAGGLAAEEFGEAVFVRVVRPLIDDEAPDAISGSAQDEFAAAFAAEMAIRELAPEPAAEALTAETPISDSGLQAAALPLAAEPEAEGVPVAALAAQTDEPAQGTPVAEELAMAAPPAPPDAGMESLQTEAVVSPVLAEAEPAAVEALAAVQAVRPEGETVEPVAAVSQWTVVEQRANLETEAGVYPAAMAAEAVAPVAAAASLAGEAQPAAVDAAVEAERLEAGELTGPPECDQLRIYAGRGETGPAAKPHFSRADDHGLWPDSLSAEPLRPKSRLLIDQADGSGPRRANAERAAKHSAGLLRFDTRKLPGRRFWAHAPSDLKWVAVGLPLILALIVYSFKASPPKSETGRPVADSRAHSVIGGELNSIQKVILDRAAIKLYDDFRGGLGSWHGSDGWAKTWKYGEASFLEPGQLALYSPTVNMRDYTMQFLGQIERRSLNWVFRATDNKNYYAMRIVITKTGPLPQASVVRYAVINGKEVGTKTLPLPFPVHSDTLYLVKMEVRGDSFTTYIQSQVVDNFSDSRLEGGGIGFFSPKGDKSYLRWVEVTHQYDVLGRLCAFLAPYNVQAEGRKTE